MNTNNNSRNRIKYNNKHHFAKFDKYLKNMKLKFQKTPQILPLVLFANNKMQKINSETFIRNFITDLVAILMSLCFIAILVYILTNNIV